MEIPIEFKTEEQFQAFCFQWFWNEYRFTPYKRSLHMNNNNSSDRAEGQKNKAKGVVRGVSDFELIIFEVVIFIELKLPGKKQKPEQIEFEQMCELLGHPYIIIETFEEFKRVIICNIGKS